MALPAGRSEFGAGGVHLPALFNTAHRVLKTV
jgi:hypothetical protein